MRLNGFLGIGWGWLDGGAIPTTVAEYERMNRATFRRANAGLRFARDVARGDLVWTRTASGSYLIFRVDGDWRHDPTEPARSMDIMCQRPGTWIEVGGPASVPGKIVADFRSPATLSRVRDPRAVEDSRVIAAGGVPRGAATADEFFALISATETEDLIALLIQDLYRYLLVPSTCRPTTQGIEFEFMGTQGKGGAVAQVKNGRVDLDDTALCSAFPKHRVFLFSTKGKVSAAHGATIITPAEAYDYACRNRAALPAPMRRRLA